MDKPISFGDAAKYLKVCPRKITEYVHRHKLPYPDGNCCFKLSDIEKLKAELNDASTTDSNDP